MLIKNIFKLFHPKKTMENPNEQFSNKNKPITLENLPDYLQIDDFYNNNKRKRPSLKDIRINAGGDQVEWVSIYDLPNGIGWRARGVKYTHAKRVKIAYELPKDQAYHTFFHEEAHSLGVKSERSADYYANSA